MYNTYLSWLKLYIVGLRLAQLQLICPSLVAKQFDVDIGFRSSIFVVSSINTNLITWAIIYKVLRLHHTGPLRKQSS